MHTHKLTSAVYETRCIPVCGQRAPDLRNYKILNLSWPGFM